MYQFRKNALFSDKLLNTLMSSDDGPPLKNMIYLNFPELQQKNLLINFILICYDTDKKCEIRCEEWCTKFYFFDFVK